MRKESRKNKNNKIKDKNNTVKDRKNRVNKDKNNKVKDINEYRKEKKNKNRNRRLKKIIKKKSKIILAVATLMFVIANMSIYSISTHLKYEVNSLEREAKQKQKQMDDLKVELDVMSKSGYIEEQAKERLNMVYPEGHQLKFIDMSN